MASEIYEVQAMVKWRHADLVVPRNPLVPSLSSQSTLFLSYHWAAGAGKTVMAYETYLCARIANTNLTEPFIRSIIVDFIRKHQWNDSVAVLCVYCNYRESSDHNISRIIANILRQVVDTHRARSEAAMGMYQLHRQRNTKPELPELLAALSADLKDFSRIFLVIDALDEYSETEGSRNSLLQSLRTMGGNASLLVTSRDILSVANIMDGALRLDIIAHDQDIRSYIRHRISCSPRRAIKDLVEDVERTVSESVKGM